MSNACLSMSFAMPAKMWNNLELQKCPGKCLPAPSIFQQTLKRVMGVDTPIFVSKLVVSKKLAHRQIAHRVVSRFVVSNNFAHRLVAHRLARPGYSRQFLE